MARGAALTGAGRTAAVIGAGPSGLAAAEALSGAGVAVTVFDRMPSIGRKFLMAGRGGLNITHSEPLDRFLSRYGPSRDRLAPLIAAFTPAELRDWCAGLGETTIVGSSGRVFPTSFKASPLLRAWAARLTDRGVRFALRQRWTGWDDEGRLTFEGAESVPANTTVLALGGASWPRLGSDGAWTAALRDVPITPLAPSNCGVRIAWSAPMARHAGAPLKGVRFSIGEATSRGEAVVTMRGLEGGGVYALGGALRAALAAGPATLTIDLKPDLPADRVAARLARRGSRSWSSALRNLGLTEAAASLAREPGPWPADAAGLAARVKAVALPVAGLDGLDRAISTAGGVAWEAVDENLMLRARPGVFLAGEMLDWDAPTGGYLLQACFATGRRAGVSAAGWVTARG